MAAAKADPRVLPKKENDLFKSIAKHYETKQYKKGIKAADQILKKFPNHGETQAMKGLVLNCLEKKTEAYDLVKLALRNDMKSHVCWHVYGLLHRSDNNYLQAIKSYKQALKIEEDNAQILRDLSLLQVQMRDLKGFVETRSKLLQQKPSHKNNWMALAVANQMAGQNKQAISVVDAFIGTQDVKARTRDYDESELMLYRADLLKEDGQLDEAIAHLEAHQSFVVDQLSWKMKMAELTLSLGHFNLAKDWYRGLLVDGGFGATENYGVHRGWQCALLELEPALCAEMLKLKACDLPSTNMQFSEEQAGVLSAAYAELQSELPRSRAAKRIPLTFLSGDSLRAGLKAYIDRALTKGVPALAADLSSLYTEETSAGSGRFARVKDTYAVSQNSSYQMVSELCDEALEATKATGRLAGAAADGPVEPPTTELWCLFLRAQLEEARGDIEEAIATIDLCIQHTPTAVDMYERRARLLRKAGDVQAAAEQMDAARKLDLADRYINNKTTKYMLRAGKLEQAMSTIALFTRHEGDPAHNLFEMQVMWVEIEYGNAAMAVGKYGMALKKFLATEKHFNDFVDDQFDFHTYCLRKMTLRAYVSILRMNDSIQSHKFYGKAAEGAIKCYIALYDNPPQSAADEEPDYANMSPAVRKREKAKARKAAKKKAEEEEAKKKAEEEEAKAKAAAEAAEDPEGKKKKKAPEKPVPVDEDPNGDKLLQADPLVEAERLVKTLVKFAPGSLSTQVAAYDVALRRKKPLKALQALVRGARIDQSGDAELFSRIVDFASRYGGVAAGGGGGGEADLSAPVRSALDLELADLMGGASLEQFVSDFAAKETTTMSLTRAMAAASACFKVNGPSSMDTAASYVLQGGLARRDVSVITCEAAHAVLVKELSAEAAAAEWHALCAAKYVRSASFGTPAASGSIAAGDPQDAADEAADNETAEDEVVRNRRQSTTM